ncbi:serine/threonine-protein kinase STY13-like isoform X2 [Macadamia integrifolia]|uniref:serine/threonine-protein kinase STY13-like isoform X2 n=1 Tax=Macadamia integrifolia TaxID=60698 RepID=UPI001C4FA72B|nr:serine/threonine-protein kinase STY13-like isoform X2 [Macadamia integrifolia]
MSCGEESKEGRDDQGEFKQTARKNSVELGSQLEKHPVTQNGLIPTPQFQIDEKLLIDPKLLYVGSKIGEGAHGKVYEGRYCDQVIAVKVLNSGSTPEEKAKLEGRFIREVTMMSRVKHENLVKFIGACKDPFMVIATELLPGMSLRKYLLTIRPKQLDLCVAIGFALDIARAMDCLHANGIIHRDLKPDNLLLTENQKSVKLADFGLAREESVTEMMTAETGTYRWMAPEQVRPSLPEDLSPDLAFIIQSCWVEDPNVRPSFSQIIRMLNQFLFTLTPPLPESDASKVAAPSRDGVITESSARARGKFSFLRQLFAARRARNSH